MLTVKRSDMKRVVESDGDCDLDDTLGTYGNSPDSPVAIDREERGDMRRGEFRYFNPAMTGEETGNPESPEQDYKRAESYNRGEWGYVGIMALVRVKVPTPQGGFSSIHTFHSPGLWGIESDSGADYFDEVFAEQVAELTEILRTFNVQVVD